MVTRFEKKFVFLSLIFLLGIFFYFLPTKIERSDLKSIIFLFFSLYFLFSLSFYFIKYEPINKLFLIGIIFRLLTIGLIPKLSDDWYRFVWDGHLFFIGENPFKFTPLEVYDNKEIFLPNYLNTIFLNLNSPNYYSVYPYPLQILFSLPWFLGYPENSYLIYQIFLLSIEIINLYTLKKQNSKKLFWFYTANPIVVIESISQIHFDTFLTLVLLMIYKFKNHILFYLFLFFLLNLKFSMYIFFILFFVTYPKKRKYLIIIFIINFFVYFFTFYFDTQISKGIGLFFHSFRFNGIFESFIFTTLNSLDSSYTYLSGSISSFLYGILLVLICYTKKFSLKSKIYSIFFFFYLFMPVNHPWYFLPAFAFLPRNKLFEGGIWSLFLAISYVYYTNLNDNFVLKFSLFQFITYFILYLFKIR